MKVIAIKVNPRTAQKIKTWSMFFTVRILLSVESPIPEAPNGLEVFN